MAWDVILLRSSLQLLVRSSPAGRLDMRTSRRSSWLPQTSIAGDGEGAGGEAEVGEISAVEVDLPEIILDRMVRLLEVTDHLMASRTSPAAAMALSTSLDNALACWVA